MSVTNTTGDSEFAGIVSRPAQRALAAAGYTRLEELTQVTEKELLSLHGFGPKGIRMLNAELAKRHLAIGSALPRDAEESAEHLCQHVDSDRPCSTTVRAAPTCSPANRNSAGGSTQ